MAIIPFFVNRVGPKNALLIGVVIMALRILSCALFHIRNENFAPFFR
ncbi:MFS transporter [Escherichia coli]